MSSASVVRGHTIHELTLDIKTTLLTPLVALSWLSVCLLVAGTGLVVFTRRILQTFQHALLQIVRA